MQNSFLQLLFFISLGVLVYLVAIAVTRIPESEQKEGEGKFFKTHPAEMLSIIDKKVAALKDKTLRRVKVVIMKIDNYISEHLYKKEDKGIFKQ